MFYHKLFSFRAISKIFEVKNIREIHRITAPLRGNRLYIWDFDNTLGHLGQGIIVGSDQWFDLHLADRLQALQNMDAAVAETLRIQKYVHENIKIQPVEAETINFIRMIQATSQHCALAVTSRSGKVLADLTRRQTNALGICFSNSVKFNNRTIDLSHLGPHCHAQDGYVFAGGQDKGLCVKHVLNTLGYSNTQYQHVICVEDKLDKVKEIGEAARELGMQFTGVRYGHLDAQIAEHGVDLDVARLQYEQHLRTGKFITHKEALRVLERYKFS